MFQINVAVKQVAQGTQIWIKSAHREHKADDYTCLWLCLHTSKEGPEERNSFDFIISLQRSNFSTAVLLDSLLHFFYACFLGGIQGKRQQMSGKKWSLDERSWKYLVLTVLLEWSHNTKTFHQETFWKTEDQQQSQPNATLPYITHIPHYTGWVWLSKYQCLEGQHSKAINQAHQQWIKFSKILINFSSSSKYEHRMTIYLICYCSIRGYISSSS